MIKPGVKRDTKGTDIFRKKIGENFYDDKKKKTRELEISPHFSS